MTLRRKLLLALVLLLVPLMAADIYYHYKQYTTRRSEAFAQYTEAAKDLARNTQLFVARTVAIERAIGQAYLTSNWRASAQRRMYVRSVVGPESVITNIAFVEPSGKVIGGYPEEAKGVMVSDRPYFRKIVNGADWAVSDLLVNRLDKKPGFIIAAAARDEGQLKGVIITRVDEKHVGQLLSLSAMRPTILVLADTEGRITYMSDHPDLSYQARVSGYHYFKPASKSPRLIINASLPGEQNLTGAMISIPTLGWSAGAFAHSGQILSSVRAATIQDISIIAAIFIFTIVVGSLLARQLTRSLDTMSATAEQLGMGKLDARIPAPRVMEFETLASTMNSMAESIQQRDEALHQAYERERRISTAFQESMLPDVPSQLGKIELATAYFPALKEAELGGDFYDVMMLPDGLIGLLVADVSGKGLEAAVHTAAAKYTLQGYAYEDPDPAKVLRRSSAVLQYTSQNDKFITAFFAVVNPDTGRMVYANAGHPQPILRHKDGSTHWLKISSGPPLGILQEPDYITEEINLLENDLLICYTDGVIEARKNSQWFDSEGLVKVAADLDCAPTEAVSKIYQSVSDFVGGELPDDIAIMAIRMSSTNSSSGGNQGIAMSA